MSVTLIQQATNTHSGSPEEVTVTFDAAPTEGDLLVAAVGVRGTGSSLVFSRSGWTSLGTTVNSPATDGLGVAYRVAVAGDPAAMLFSLGAGCSGQNRCNVIQVRFGDTPLFDASATATGNSAAPTVNVDPTDGRETLLIAAAIQNNAAGNDFTAANGETELYDNLCDAAFNPGNWLATRVIPVSTAGNYTLGATTVGSGGWAIRGMSFQSLAAVAVQTWIIDFGGLRPSGARQLRRLTRNIRS